MEFITFQFVEHGMRSCCQEAHKDDKSSQVLSEKNKTKTNFVQFVPLYFAAYRFSRELFKTENSKNFVVT